MLSSCRNYMQGQADGYYHRKTRKTAESENLNSENTKEDAWSSKEIEVEDWIEKERKIEIQEVRPQPKYLKLTPKSEYFKLPPKNHNNKWTPSFQLVYHQQPPSIYNHSQQPRTEINEQAERGRHWGPSIDTQFNKIQIQDILSKHYYCPIPYGFDANRSRIIVGDRKHVNIIDCTFKEFVTRFSVMQNEKHFNLEKIL